MSFVKVDIEGAESAGTPDIAAFPHPGLVVALEVEPRMPLHPEAIPRPSGLYVPASLHNDYRWRCATRCRPSPTTYRKVAGRSLVNVLVSRQPLDRSYCGSW